MVNLLVRLCFASNNQCSSCPTLPGACFALFLAPSHCNHSSHPISSHPTPLLLHSALCHSANLVTQQQWTGQKVGEVESIPQNIEGDFDRFGNRIEGGFDNAVNDVEYAPEEVSNWAGRKVGDVERFDDNVDNAYDEGKYEGRYDDRY